MYCSQCGKEISDDSKFCTFCGNKCKFNVNNAEKKESENPNVNKEFDKDDQVANEFEDLDKYMI